MSKEAMKLALEALENLRNETSSHNNNPYCELDLIDTGEADKAIKALEEALKQEQSEPDYKTLAIQLQQERKQEQGEPVAIPEGFSLIAVKGFDELMCWLDRCEDKGHLENCPDLIEPYKAFDYRTIDTTPQQPKQERCESLLVQNEATTDDMHAIGNGIMYGEQDQGEPVAWHVYFGNDDEPNYVVIGEKPNEPRAVIRPLIFGDATPQPKQEQGEPVFHLKQFGDVTKEEFDRYCATGDINPPQQRTAAPQAKPVDVPENKGPFKKHYPQCSTCNLAYITNMRDDCGWGCDGKNMYSHGIKE
jgi:hypothetical protein